MNLNHFVCTLEKAEAINEGLSVPKTIPDFLKHQAETVPWEPAVGFGYPLERDGSVQCNQTDIGSEDYLARVKIRKYSFLQVYEVVAYVAKRISQDTPELVPGETVALLCPSTPDFLFTWLGLVALGNPVLLVAPQLPSSAISHLCNTCEARKLFYDKVFESKAKDAESISGQQSSAFLTARLIPVNTQSENFKSAFREFGTPSLPSAAVSKDSTAFIFHSSGTSSGMPKSIPQSHNGAIGVLPRLSDCSRNATFSTTPLYHGGIADLFRSWSSNAMIWLFPGKDYENSKELQLTSRNVLSSLQVGMCTSLRKVSYFSSVPWIVQMIREMPEGLRCLRKMDIVGIGGAALAAEEGQRLIKQGIPLVSRYGSAECGFLLSSHREYGTDKAWDYLRADPEYSKYRFEPHGDGKFELVVLPSWPHRAKTNCEDGSFRTADLFKPHPTIPHAWKYDSRADSQMTLATGKKFDPAPLEASLAASDLLDDAFVFGEGKPYPGAILFRSDASYELSDEEFLDLVCKHLDVINSESQRHAQISKHMLVPLPQSQNALPKSSKGTVLRTQAQEIYSETIENTYGNLNRSLAHVPDEEVLLLVRSIVQRILDAELGTDESILAYGVDSIMLTQIRLQIQRLLPPDSALLPMTLVENYYTMDRLAGYIVDRRNGDLPVDDHVDPLEMMDEILDRFSDFSGQTRIGESMQLTASSDIDPSEKETVLLTGATGMLGAQLLDMYRNDQNVRKIYCLVRESPRSQLNPRERVSHALAARELEPLPTPLASIDNRVEILTCKLGDLHLGLQPHVYDRLVSEVTTIMHAAWAVNFRLELQSYVDEHIAGTRHLLDLAHAAIKSSTRAASLTPTFVFCSSVASVAGSLRRPVPESISDDPSDAANLGYGRSKWIAENLCASAAGAGAVPDVAVFRVGQLSCDSRTGVWNMSEAYPLMLSSAEATGCLPDLGDEEKLEWLPVDVAAACLIQGAKGMRGSGLKVYHVLNDASPASSWSDLLGWIKGSKGCEIVQPAEWLDRLEGLQARNGSHPALGLLGHWRERFGGEQMDDGDGAAGESGSAEAVFDTSVSKKHIQALADGVKPIEKEYFDRCWSWIKRQG